MIPQLGGMEQTGKVNRGGMEWGARCEAAWISVTWMAWSDVGWLGMNPDKTQDSPRFMD